ncbi:hypothetical protein [Sphingomonas alpina]|uniref:DUF1440 domain-containing protein n=1 Tax=Sphingomonas alpina TaxID=653931 RepID=A0A7H0LDH6_9SPHN|nr:hypothetical protein [Sphingomonas alpina]QNQ07729.1 hypothetical protein H3Z74_12975 [Sphingomonas alpina]
MTAGELPGDAGPLGALILAAVAGGGLGGVLDIGAACLMFRRGPATILQSIASGLVGPGQAFGGGAPMMVLGAIAHLLIAIIVAFAFILLAQRWPLLWSNLWMGAAGLGVATYLVMNLIVVPLSRAQTPPATPIAVVIGVAVHILVFALPIVWVTRAILRQVPAA